MFRVNIEQDLRFSYLCSSSKGIQTGMKEGNKPNQGLHLCLACRQTVIQLLPPEKSQFAQETWGTNIEISFQDYKVFPTYFDSKMLSNMMYE